MAVDDKDSSGSVSIDPDPETNNGGSEKKKTKVTAKKGIERTAESEEQRRSFIDSEDAKETVVWFIIKFTLTLCGCITAGIFFIDAIVNKESITSSKDVISDIKSLWETFFPIITLSLGYLFGKTQNKTESGK